MKHLASGIVLILFSLQLWATVEEKKDTVVLTEVIKIDEANSNTSTGKIFTEARLGKRLPDALGEISSVYIKNYGPGQLASLAVRGTSAAQTEIQWNGMRLNSPCLGQVDLSLFQLGMQDELQLVRTGWNGTIGGTLRMNNELKIDSGVSLKASVRYGSFNTIEAFANASYRFSWLSGSTKISYLKSDNDFKFHNTSLEGNPLVKQTNAEFVQLGILQQISMRANETNNFNFYFWYSHSDRNLPPVMTKTEGHEKQFDRSYRAMADWKMTKNNFRLSFASAYLRDELIYKDGSAAINDTTVTHAVRNILSLKYIFRFPIVFSAQANYDYERAYVRYYNQNRSRNTAGIKVNADYYFLKNFQLHLGFRQDLIDKKLSTFAPQLTLLFGKEFTTHQLAVSISASRNFRTPTFNDLYWIPGGNQNLKQEKSWNTELQVIYKFNKLIDISISNFYIYVDDWIQWIPGANGIWGAQNFRKVFSRGAEASLHFTSSAEENKRRFIFSGNASYSFTKATNLMATSAFDHSKGKQMIYVPLHNATLTLQAGYKNFYLRLTNNATGKTYTATDNSAFLQPYVISDAELGKNFYLNKCMIGCSFRVNNMGNIRYQVVAQRPMPCRSFEGTIRFNLKS